MAFGENLGYGAHLMRINLTEIPEDGRSWEITQKGGELNEALSDLTGPKSQYHAEFTIRPLQSGTFDLTGTIKTTLPELCSRCGDRFQWAVSEKFHELLLPAIAQPRNSSYTKPNHISDLASDELSTFEYHGNLFDVGEYLHEVVAISLPKVPAPPKDDKGRCAECKIPVGNQLFTYDEQMEEVTNPFGILESLKKN